MLLVSYFEITLLIIIHLDQNNSQVKYRDLNFNRLQTMESLKDYGCKQEMKSPFLNIWDNLDC